MDPALSTILDLCRDKAVSASPLVDTCNDYLALRFRLLSAPTTFDDSRASSARVLPNQWATIFRAAVFSPASRTSWRKLTGLVGNMAGATRLNPRPPLIARRSKPTERRPRTETPPERAENGRFVLGSPLVGSANEAPKFAYSSCARNSMR